eukprot:SAG22_NODE_894_length_6640_cov_3.923559_2_plen_201_part_00
MGFECVVLTHNESAERRQATSGQIRTHRRHRERGLLQAGLDRRSHLMQWRIDIMKALFPHSARYMELAALQEATIKADYTRRGLFVETFEKEVEALKAASGDAVAAGSTLKSLQGTAASTLHNCPVKVEKRKLAYLDGDGLYTVPESVRNSWAHGEGEHWETPFPLPDSKRLKAAVAETQRVALAAAAGGMDADAAGGAV